MKKHTSSSKNLFMIEDYGHDRAVHSLGRGGKNARRQQRRRNRAVGGLILLVVVAIAAWLLWPALSGLIPGATSAATTTSSGTTGTTAGATTDGSSAVTTGTTASGTTAATETAATLSPAERKTRLTAAANQATVLLQGESGRFAIYFFNLETDEKWSYKADQPFVAASSIKLGINTYLYTKIASGEISPAKNLIYDSRPYPTGDYEAGTGTIQGQPNGTVYSVRDTSGLSIRISDNCATNMIIRLLGGIDAINPYLNSISGVVDYRKSVTYRNYAGQTASGRHRSCAQDLGSHAVNLYRLWQADKKFYQPLIDDLCRTEFDFGIQKGIPSGVQVAHKIGTNGTYCAENDVGIVWASEPFALCVMTEMGSAAEAHKIQADIARIFYEYIESMNPA